MAISIFYENELFNSTLVVVFKANQNSEEKTEIKTKDALVFIDKDKKLLSINIFNYKKYFSNIQEGFHYFSSENKKIILDNFGSYFSDFAFDENILISNIKSVTEHPKSANLLVLEVENKFGSKTVLTNVKTIKANNNYLIAFDGAFLANGIIIKESKINSIKSEGMLVSYKSLGINKEGLIDVSSKNISDNFIEF